MKFIAEQRELEDKLSKVKGAVATKDTIPILRGFLIAGNQVVATDLEIGIKTNINAEIIEKGAAVFPADIFSIVKQMPDKPITIEVDDNWKAEISCNGIEVELSCYDAEEYPQLPSVDDPSTLTANSYNLEQAIKLTSPSISTDDSQPALTGIMLNEKDAVATNTYRLAKFGANLGFDNQLILPAKSAKEVASLARDCTEVEIEYSSNYAKFNMEGTTVFSRLIEGQFPNYEQVIPDESNTIIRADKGSLISCLKRAITVDSGEGVITLVTDGSTLNVSLSDDESSFEEKVDIELEGDEQEIRLDVNYLLDGVKLLGEDEVKIKLIDYENPIVLEENEFIYLVMPIRRD